MTSQADEMRERRALAGSDNATAYFQQSQVAEELDAKAGRFAKPSVVSGANPTVQYPRLPASSPWAADMVPPRRAPWLLGERSFPDRRVARVGRTCWLRHRN